MGHLWEIAQAHMDAYGVREAALARRMGTSPQTLNSWKKRGLHRLPERWLLWALARETRTDYEDVLRAALLDIRYLPKEVVERELRSASMTTRSAAPEPPAPAAAASPGTVPPSAEGTASNQGPKIGQAPLRKKRSKGKPHATGTHARRNDETP